MQNLLSSGSTENDCKDQDAILNTCLETFNKVFHVSQNHLNKIVETLQAMENEKRNHMRSHYDQKLNICRVSYRLEQSYMSSKSKVETLDVGGKMNLYYKEKIDHLARELEQTQAMRNVQDSTLIETQESLTEERKKLQCTNDDFKEYKEVMQEKCSNLEDNLNGKRKQEVWAHFKIAHLKKKVKKANETLQTKTQECYKKQAEIKELQSRLKRSLEIREGLERAFEKRASIRGRLEILQENNKLQKKKSCSSISFPKLRKTCVEKGIQVRMNQQGTEMKDQGVDTPPFFSDQLDHLQHLKDETEHSLQESNKTRDHALRQNEAYRSLVSGSNIAIILASKHRELCSKFKSIDTEILHDLTTKSLLPKKEREGKEREENKSVEGEKPSTPPYSNDKHSKGIIYVEDHASKRMKTEQISKSATECNTFGGICGTQIACSFLKNAHAEQEAATVISPCAVNRESTQETPPIPKLSEFEGTYICGSLIT